MPLTRAIFFGILGIVHAGALPVFFEPADSSFVASLHGRFIEILPRKVRFSSVGVQGDASIDWHRAKGGPVSGEDATGGVTHYLAGAPETHWRTGVPHYSRVRVRNLYPNVDVAYYFEDGHLEFDAILHQGSNVSDLQFELAGATHLSVDSAGDLTMEAGGGAYRFRRPNAYQVTQKIRQKVDCKYSLDAKGRVGFHVGDYDHRRDLIIDPVVQFVTYLGGSGIDEIQSIAADPAGNIIVAGITNSVNFPGGGTPAPGAMSIFVTKLNSPGTAVIFTTLLGSRPNANPFFTSESATSIAVDSDGSIYLTGVTFAQNFPITAGAWQQNPATGFVTKLNATGKIVYSTYLGPPSWALSARRVRVRDGIAYLAGTVSRAEFLGTSGALQRGVAGGDFFALTIAPDGSGPWMVTAFGGSGQESLSDMTLDATGDIVLAGVSNSTDLPLTGDALPYQPPADGSYGAVLVRLDSAGSRLVSSTWLGMRDVRAVATVPDGDIVIAGGSALPSDLMNSAPHYSIDLGRPGQAYFVKFAPNSNLPLWTTSLISTENLQAGISADGLGNIYWSGSPSTASGGALGFDSSAGISELSSDGSRLLFSSPLPGVSDSLAAIAAPGGLLYVAGSTSSSLFPVTPGVLQPLRDPAPSGTFQAPLNSNDGVVGVLDLSSFTSGNFFVVRPQTGLAVTWRIGEPAPAAISLPLSGNADSLSVTAEPGLIASYAAASSPSIGIPSLSINVDTGQLVSGSFQKSVIVRSPSNPNAVLSIPVALTIKPAVSFELADSQVTIRHQLGQPPNFATVAVTENFGSEKFSFNVISSVPWLSGNLQQIDGAPVLAIFVQDLDPGAYDGTLTVSLDGLQNGSRVVQVHFIVDPASGLVLSAPTISLHVAKGQPAKTAVVTVTGSVPGSKWSIRNANLPAWLSVTQTTSVTPGEIHITADPNAAEVGYGSYNILVLGTTNVGTSLVINVDVSSGAPLDVTPASINIGSIRAPYGLGPSQVISFTSPSPVNVQWASDQPWLLPRSIGTMSGSLTTPALLNFYFDSSITAGLYHAKITATAGSTTVVVPVTWNLSDNAHLVYSTDPILFQWRVGDPPPAAKQLSVTFNTPQGGAFYAFPNPLPSFFSVDQSSSKPFATPVTLSLVPDPTGRTPGVYQSSLAFQPLYPDENTYARVPVTLTVLPDLSAPKATVTQVTDAASYLGGAISPGEAVLLVGSGLGPATLIQAQPGSDGRYSSTLAGWMVYFDEIPAPIVYISDKATVVMTPFGVAGRSTTNVTVVTGGITSVAKSVTVAATNPSVFTANASGSGNAAAINFAADGSYTFNQASSPAPRGGVVTLYATGFGLTAPLMLDGSVPSVPLPTLSASVRVLVGGQTADLLFAGPAPGEIAGITQINIRIPANSPTGSAPLLVIAGDTPSQPGVTLAVR